jgi:hypothetical protein
MFIIALLRTRLIPLFELLHAHPHRHLSRALDHQPIAVDGNVEVKTLGAVVTMPYGVVQDLA